MQTIGLLAKLKFETAGNLECLEFTYKTKRCLKAEDKNLRSRTFQILLFCLMEITHVQL